MPPDRSRATQGARTPGYAARAARLDAALSARVLDLLARDPRAVLLVTHDAAALDDRWRVVDLDADEFRSRRRSARA